MGESRSDGSAPGEHGEFTAVTTGESSNAGRYYDTREGDVIQGLRSGLLFSLAIWAMLLTVGTLVFA